MTYIRAGPALAIEGRVSVLNWPKRNSRPREGSSCAKKRNPFSKEQGAAVTSYKARQPMGGGER